jgi:hypothetical protein
MHLQLPYAGPHTKPRSHSLKDSMRKGENSWSILWGCVYFPSKSSTSILRCASAADRKRQRLDEAVVCKQRIRVEWCDVHRALPNDDLSVPCISFQLSYVYHFSKPGLGIEDVRNNFARVWSQHIVMACFVPDYS